MPGKNTPLSPSTLISKNNCPRTSQLKIEDVQAAWTAFRVYQKGKADFADCLMGTTNRLSGCETTVTFDQAASKLEGFKLV